MKEVVLHIKARETVRGFSSSAKDDIGLLLRRLQNDETLAFPNSRPMPEIERGAYELRVRDADGIYRVFYYLKSAKAFWYFTLSQRKPRSRLKRKLN